MSESGFISDSWYSFTDAGGLMEGLVTQRYVRVHSYRRKSVVQFSSLALM